MPVAEALLDAVRKGGSRRVFVVGTGKNVGKTVAMRAIADAASARGLTVGMTSTGRDGEAVDAADAHAKPRLFLRPGTIIATARGLLPSHPASELLVQTPWPTAAGAVHLARVRRSGYFELAGPPTAATMNACLTLFEHFECDMAIVDGALDRVAALAAGADAIVVSAGAASSAAMDEAVSEACALVRKLSMPAFDPSAPFVRMDGALTAARAAHLRERKERRQIVLRDPTQLVATGHTATGMLDGLDIRCERPVRVAAVTAASIGPDRYFEPRAFARALAGATRLPVFDIYADTLVAAA